MGKLQTSFFEEWLKLKKQTIETKDLEFYTWFLKETRKVMTKLYVEMKRKEVLELIENILKLVRHELCWVKNTDL